MRQALLKNVSGEILEIGFGTGLNLPFLKPGGKFFFIEHGLSQDLSIQIWQHRLTPVQKAIADGCHLNRRINELVAAQFANLTLEQFYAPRLPKVIGYMYQGVAVK